MPKTTAEETLAEVLGRAEVLDAVDTQWYYRGETHRAYHKEREKYDHLDKFERADKIRWLLEPVLEMEQALAQMLAYGYATWGLAPSGVLRKVTGDETGQIREEILNTVEELLIYGAHKNLVQPVTPPGALKNGLAPKTSYTDAAKTLLDVERIRDLRGAPLRQRTPYDQAFAEALLRAKNAKSITNARICAVAGMSENTLRKWLKLAESYNTAAPQFEDDGFPEEYAHLLLQQGDPNDLGY